MNYELAKELKDAGYPLRRIEAGMCVGPWPVLDMNPSGDQEIGAQHFYAPFLEELIEACGESLHCLVHTKNGGLDMDKDFWSAGIDNQILGWSNGNTPTEAVARLWLALHKNSE